MRKTILTIIAAGVFAAVPATAGAEPSDIGECRQDGHDVLVDTSTEGTYGDFMSDVIFGNEPNIEGPFAPGGPEEQEPGDQAGRVVPSLTPGPASMNGGFFTGGELQAIVRAACNS